MGFERNNIIESLRNRVQNEVTLICCIPIFVFCGLQILTCFLHVLQGTVAYYLLLDNRFRASSGYLGAEFQESVVRWFCL